MAPVDQPYRLARSAATLLSLVGLAAAGACAPAASVGGGVAPVSASTSPTPPSPDPRIGLRAGLYDAAQASWNMRLVSTSKSPERFEGVTNSDLAFKGNYAIQGNYNGYVVWDISNPSRPAVTTAYYCPASQSDVSVYRNLLFVSGEGLSGRLDCGGQGVSQAVSRDRLRGLRIFDISDIRNPRNVGNVQTCRGSHTHTVLVDPRDSANVYVYISGSSSVRSDQELPGCVEAGQEANSALFRIEVIKVPVANPAAAAIVTSPRIFTGLVEAPEHGDTPAELAAARARGGYTGRIFGGERIIPNRVITPLLDSIVKARGGTGARAATAADSAALRTALPGILEQLFGTGATAARGPRPGPDQCHDITVFPGIGYAGGACEGYGLLLDIRNPANPVRVDAVADSNFSYWHSATFNNDGTKVLFSDEWGGGGQAKCRATDPKEWGANALFTIVNGKMQFQSYYKLPAPQTEFENCVAHNGSLVPIPGRDVMVQAWYQGGISVFDWTDARNPVEIAFFDRGPSDATRMGSGGSWSAYWYNGAIVSSEISRGLDVLELTPSAWLTQNEIDAAKTVRWDHLNPQGQPKIVWPPSFALSRAYVDQLERSRGLPADRISAIRASLASAERLSGSARGAAMHTLATEVEATAAGSSDAAKVRLLASSLHGLMR